MKKKAIIVTSLVIFILAVLAGSLIYYFRIKPNMEEDKLTKKELQWQIDNFNIKDIPMYDLPKNIKSTAKKYSLFEDIYTSDQTVFLYGYEKGSKNQNYSAKFHKGIKKAIKANNLNDKYKIITLSKPQQMTEKALKKMGINAKEKLATCESTDPSFMEMIMTTAYCYNAVCIIDSKKNKYIVLPKKYPEIIVKALIDYKAD